MNFRACSQKLAAWQENEIVGSTGIEKLKLGSLTRASHKSTKKSSKDDNKIVRYKSDNNNKNSIGNQETSFGKVKKKTRTTFHKLVETADIISHLAKNTKSSSAKIKKPIQNNTVTTTIVNTINTNKIQRFKTTGIVATAVQNNKKHKKFLQLSLSPKTIPENDTEMSTSDPENTKMHSNKHKQHSLKAFKENTSRKSEKLS